MSLPKSRSKARQRKLEAGLVARHSNPQSARMIKFFQDRARAKLAMRRSRETRARAGRTQNERLAAERRRRRRRKSGHMDKVSVLN